MRGLVIAKILFFKNRCGFDPSSLRWNKGTRKHPNSRYYLNGTHFSEVDWEAESLSDEDLLNSLEIIISQNSKQM